jgi:2-polyprenyl-6-methoxyphenol hydroxylase-like FAD-dependent oxidoreductase
LQFDVVIVGGSLGGCAAAIGFADRGLRVALIERRSDPDAWKPLCTHNLQACASPVIRSLGLEPALKAAGGVPTHTEMWTPWGWIRDPAPVEHGWNIRRSTLDPLVRARALASAGVTPLLGVTVDALVTEGSRIVGVRAGETEFRGQLVVAADGRPSPIANLAGLPLSARPHGRFVRWAYFEGMDVGTESRMWFQDPRCAYVFPNDGGRTLVACFVNKDELPAWRDDGEALFHAMIGTLADAPKLGTRVTPFYGAYDLPNTRRPVTGPGLALIGDAALAPDPLFGLGCGWALQSAWWLVEATSGPLKRGIGLRLGLERYRATHALRLTDHFRMTSSYSTGRPFNAVERRLYSTAARDPEVAHAFLTVGARLEGAVGFLRPRVFAKVWRARG